MMFICIKQHLSNNALLTKKRVVKDTVELQETMRTTPAGTTTGSMGRIKLIALNILP